MKRRFVYLLVMVFIMVTFIPNLAFGQQEIQIIVNDKKLKSDVEPFIEKGRTMVPIRFIGEALGATVSHEETIIAGSPNDLITLSFPNGRSVFINVLGIHADGINFDDWFDQDAGEPFMIKKDRSFVSIRSIAYALHMDVTWNQNTKTVTLTTNNTEDSYPLYLSTDTLNDEPNVEQSKKFNVVFKNGRFELNGTNKTLSEYYEWINSDKNKEKYQKEYSETTLFHNNLFTMNKDGDKITGYIGG